MMRLEQIEKESMGIKYKALQLYIIKDSYYKYNLCNNRIILVIHLEMNGFR